MEIGNT